MFGGDVGRLISHSPKLKAKISQIEIEKCDGDREMNRKHFSNELEIFEATGEETKNIKLLFNSPKAILQLS